MCTGILQSLSVPSKAIFHFYVAFVLNAMTVYRDMEVINVPYHTTVIIRAEPSASKSGPLTFKNPQ